MKKPTIILSALLWTGVAAAQPEPVPPEEPPPTEEPSDPPETPPDPTEEPAEPPAPVEPPAPMDTPTPVEPPAPAQPKQTPDDDTLDAGVQIDVGNESAADQPEGSSPDVEDGPGPLDMWVGKLRASAGIDVITQYRFSLFQEDDQREWFHEFELPRAHGILHARYEDAEARFIVEGVRSASEGALIGVAGDSIVLRLREAYAGYRLFDMLKIEAGVVRTLSLPTLERAWAFRSVAPVGLQRTGLISPADLGARTYVELPLDIGWVGAAGYNGEGYNGRELNRGKNTELATQIHPLFFIDDGKPFSVFFSLILGSSGTGLARADRYTGALLWDAPRLGVGATATYAQGIDDRSSQEALLVEGWVRGEPLEDVLLVAQVSNYWRNLDAEATDSLLTITGAAGYRIIAPIEALLAADGFLLSDAASTALPGFDDVRIRVVTRVRFD